MIKPWENWKLELTAVDKALYNLAVSFTLLFVCVTILPHLPMDHYIEQLFYNPAKHEWLVEKENSLLRTIFYYGTKYSIALFGFILIGVLIHSYYKREIKLDRKAILFVIICLVIIPSTIAFLKYLTGMPCPYQLNEYGGVYQYRDFLSFNWPDGTDRPSCFPAGHPSGGFALLALAFITKNKKKAIAIAVTLGFIMSLYQMMRGAHFISHCLVTLFFSLTVINAVYLSFAAFAKAKTIHVIQESYGQDRAI